MPSGLRYAPGAHLEKRARQGPWLREPGGLGLQPREQTWKDLRLLANKAQIEARSSDRSHRVKEPPESWSSGEAGRQPAPVRTLRASRPGLVAWLYLRALSQDARPP